VARVYLMSWIPRQKRWMKMYRGKRYAVSCRQLRVPATKDDSWRAANDWWEAKQAELDAAVRPVTDQGTLDVVSVLQREGGVDLLDRIDKGLGATNMLILLEAFVKENLREPAQVEAAGRKFLEAYRAGTLPQDLVEQTFTRELVNAFEGSVQLLAEGPPVSPDLTVGGQVRRWVETQRALATAGEITPDRADNNRICLYHFRDFVGAGSAVEAVDEAKLHEFFLFCLRKVEVGRNAKQRGKKPKRTGGPKKERRPPNEEKKEKDAVEAKECWSAAYAKKVFDVARTFIRFLWESRLIELPRNIGSKAFRFGNGAKAVQTWTVEEFKELVGAATGQLKLHLLLMANCGMLQTDISDLLDSEVDWTDGRLTRKRSKTRDSGHVPTVSYKLWPLTFELLKQYRSGGDVVLLTESGNRWVDKRLLDGCLVKADNIASCYAWLKKRTGFKKPLKQIRKTSASLIESHAEYGRYKSHFLGHSPRSVADRHYAAPSPELFDRVVAWLGEKYGFCSAGSQRPAG
jgi:integrase